jgi:hypothetical protein
MGFNSAFKIVKNPGKGRLNNLSDPALNVLKYILSQHFSNLNLKLLYRLALRA